MHAWGNGKSVIPNLLEEGKFIFEMSCTEFQHRDITLSCKLTSYISDEIMLAFSHYSNRHYYCFIRRCLKSMARCTLSAPQPMLCQA